MQRRHDPAKMTSEPQDLQNYLQAPQNWFPSLSDVTKPPAILSPRPAFWLQKKIFGFYFHQEPFFLNSQHDEIVQNDTLTFCVKK